MRQTARVAGDTRRRVRFTISARSSLDEKRARCLVLRRSGRGAFTTCLTRFRRFETRYVPVDLPVKHGPGARSSRLRVFSRAKSFIDEVAQECGADPLAFRLKLLKGAETSKPGRCTIDRRRLRRVLEVVRDKSGWGKTLAARHGRGVACNIYDGTLTSPMWSMFRLMILDTVRVERVVAAVDCGLVINPIGVEQQIEGGIIWGISSVLGGQITFKGGVAQQSTYADFARRADARCAGDRSAHRRPRRGDRAVRNGRAAGAADCARDCECYFRGDGKTHPAVADPAGRFEGVNDERNPRYPAVVRTHRGSGFALATLVAARRIELSAAGRADADLRRRNDSRFAERRLPGGRSGAARHGESCARERHPLMRLRHAAAFRLQRQHRRFCRSGARRFSFQNWRRILPSAADVAPLTIFAGRRLGTRFVRA